MKIVSEVRTEVLTAARTCKEDGFETVIIQGSGTYGLEAVIGSVVPRDGKLLILRNGAYGARQQQICEYLDVDYQAMNFPDNRAVTPEDVAAYLDSVDAFSITHVSVVHHETTAGLMNPIGDIGRFLKRHYPHIELIVDSMSAFGAYPVDMVEDNISYLVSSPNKCIEGVPGFCFVVADRQKMLAKEGCARSLALDLQSQWRGLECSGQFRFTPPTHSVIAFHQALQEWKLEGGVEGRAERYKVVCDYICTELVDNLGFEFFLKDASSRGYIITTFMQPCKDEAWDFERFYRILSNKGIVIYSGKLTALDAKPTFRLGHIGRVSLADAQRLVSAIKEACDELCVKLPLRR